MQNERSGSLWQNKLVQISFAVGTIALLNLTFWLSDPSPDSDGRIYKLLFSIVLIGLSLFATLYFFSELKKINELFWRPVFVLFACLWVFLNYRYPGVIFFADDGRMRLLEQPIVWMLAATTVGYLAARIYNRGLMPHE